MLQFPELLCLPLRRGLESSAELKQVEKEVKSFGSSFAMPGFDVSALKKGTNGHVSSNGFGDTNGLPVNGNDLSTSVAYDKKVENAAIAN